MKSFRLLKSGLGVAAILVALLAQTSFSNADTLNRVKSEGKLVVATEMQFPPFDFLENGVYTGVNKDLMDEVGKELGVQIQFVDLPWTSVLPGLEAKKFDFVGAPINASKERMARFTFTSPIAYSAIALIKAKGNEKIAKSEDVAGMTVGVVKATAAQKQLAAFSSTLSTPITIREYTDRNQVYVDVANGRLDAGAAPLPNVSYAATKRPGVFEVVTPAFGAPNYFGWIARKDPEDASLAAAISSAVQTMKKDGRLAKIQEKWFGRTEELPDVMPEPAF